MNKDKMIGLLNDYFNISDTSAYWLTRVKEGFAYGTVTLDDFVEFDNETIEDLATLICDNIA